MATSTQVFPIRYLRNSPRSCESRARRAPLFEILAQRGRDHMRKARWHCIADQLLALDQATAEAELVRESLQSSTLSQGQITILEGVQELRASRSRNRLAWLIPSQPSKPGWRSTALVGRRTVHDPAKGSSPIAFVPQVRRQVAHYLTRLEPNRPFEIDTRKRRSEMVRWLPWRARRRTGQPLQSFLQCRRWREVPCRQARTRSPIGRMGKLRERRNPAESADGDDALSMLRHTEVSRIDLANVNAVAGLD